MFIRDVAAGDVRTLAQQQPTLAMHADRVRDADGVRFRYLVAERQGRLAGWGLLFFQPEAGWMHPEWFPQVFDLFVAPASRGQGVGTALIGEMERITGAAGHPALHLAVEPGPNPRAHRLYVRLGYRALQAEPYEDHYRFVDSAGGVHEGTEWLIMLRKALATGPVAS